VISIDENRKDFVRVPGAPTEEKEEATLPLIDDVASDRRAHELRVTRVALRIENSLVSLASSEGPDSIPVNMRRRWSVFQPGTDRFANCGTGSRRACLSARPFRENLR
jgi:hypothetical protein